MLSSKKRKFFSKLPLYFFILVVLFGIAFALSYGLPRVINNSFISPLAINKVYKHNSIEDLLSKNNVQFDKVLIATDSSYIVFLKDDGQVNISARNTGQQISSLQLILRQLTIEGKKFKRLDLRFDKPIIEF